MMNWVDPVIRCRTRERFDAERPGGHPLARFCQCEECGTEIVYAASSMDAAILHAQKNMGDAFTRIIKLCEACDDKLIATKEEINHVQLNCKHSESGTVTIEPVSRFDELDFNGPLSFYECLTPEDFLKEYPLLHHAKRNTTCWNCAKKIVYNLESLEKHKQTSELFATGSPILLVCGECALIAREKLLEAARVGLGNMSTIHDLLDLLFRHMERSSPKREKP